MDKKEVLELLLKLIGPADLRIVDPRDECGSWGSDYAVDHTELIQRIESELKSDCADESEPSGPG